jgi:HSP20 family protein
MLGYWDEMRALERRVDELMRTFFGTRTMVGRRPFVPPIDVYERKGDLVVHAELPGLDPVKDVKVYIEDGALVITGERLQKEEVDEKDLYRMETSYGAFTRRVALPEGIDEDTIRADYKEGVLEVLVPKAAKQIEAPKTKEIPIHTGKPVKAA